MVECIDHINIVVRDLNKSSEFFQALGFTVQHEGDLQGEWISMIVGLKEVQARFVSLELLESQTRLELIKYYSPESPEDAEIRLANKMGFRHMALRVSDIEKTVSALRELEVEFLSPIQSYEPTKKRLVYFYGPDGILLELSEYGRSGCSPSFTQT